MTRALALILGTLAAGSAFAADLILYNGRIATVDASGTIVPALAIDGARVTAVGLDADVLKLRTQATRVIDLEGRTVIPGLIDSHTHVIRGGLNYNLELRWEDVRSVGEGLALIRMQAARTPKGQWVRIVGGFCEMQFEERRLPTLDELNEVAPDTPVFILHLYDRALLNRAAIAAVGYGASTPEPTGGRIERDASGAPTGLLLAQPNASILYHTLARGPKLSVPEQVNSTLQFMRELNRLGVTSIVDAGGGFQNYPEDYAVVEQIHDQGLMTVRVAYNLFPQAAKRELEDFRRWAAIVKPGQGDDFYRFNGAGEMLVYSAADFEDFREPRPDLPPTMEPELRDVVSFLVQNRWPFRLHATYGESITRFLDVMESVDRETPFGGLRWYFDHAETIADADIERVKRLGGGIAVQHRIAYQGEYFQERYGKAAASHAPPLRRLIAAGVPVAAGTDATRVSGFNPWLSLSWLVTGNTVGGTPLYGDDNRLTREEALGLWTSAAAWFSSEEGKKGSLVPGQLADLAVLSDDYFTVPEHRIRDIRSVLTIVGGKAVYGEGEYAESVANAVPVDPSWSPVALQRKE
ncbi:MAG: amidohydrolase [Candidatus Eiseniibacteriota bacterium]